jgi:hypothetical protein
VNRQRSRWQTGWRRRWPCGTSRPHRSLAANPSPPNLACVARVQALIATTSGVVAEAAAQTSMIDSAASERFATIIDTSHLAWTRAANRSFELISCAARTDPPLLGAAGEVHAAIAATAHHQTGWATGDLIASRLDLPTAVSQLQLAAAAAVDLAYVTRDIALTELTMTAPARAIAMRTQAGAEQAVDHGERRYLRHRLGHLPRRHANRIVPRPDPARRGLVDTTEQVITSASQAAAAATTLTPPDGRNGPGTLPRRCPPAQQQCEPLQFNRQTNQGRVDEPNAIRT